VTAGRLRRAGLTGGLLVLALGAAPAAAAAQASTSSPPSLSAAPSAAPARAPLAVTLSSVTPTALTAATPLVVSGTVSNTGTTPLTGLRLTLRFAPLSTRAEVTRWADGEETFETSRIGAPLRLDRPLPAGGSAPFTLTVPAVALPFDPRQDRLQALGLVLRAEGSGPGLATAPVATARSFAVWQPRPTAGAVHLSVLVPVTEGVATGAAGAASAHPPATWSPTGRLARVLRATAGTGFSYAIDPALLTAASATVAAGSAPATSPGPTPGASGTPAGSPGPTATPAASPSGTAAGTPGGSAGDGGLAAVSPAAQAATAADWLRQVKAATAAAAADVVALPWADPDVVATARGSAPDLVDLADAQARATVTSVLGRTVPSVLWPAQGRTDATSLWSLVRRDDRTVVLDGAGLPAQALEQGARTDLSLASPGRATRDARVAHAVVADPALGRLIASGGAAAVPQVLADLAVTAAARPGQSVLVTLPRGWNPDAAAVGRLTTALGSAGWVDVRPFTALAGAAAGSPRTVRLTYASAYQRLELPAAYVDAVAKAQRRLATFAPALVEPDRVVPPLRQEALSLVGLGWRGATPFDRTTAQTRVTKEVDDIRSGISIEPGSTKNLLAKEGRLPISVVNTLQYAVHVRLVLIPRTGQLAFPGPIDLVLQPGPRTVAVPVRALANGDVMVVATFQTPDGRAELYRSPDIEVRVRSDWEGRGVLVVALLLGVLLAVGLARGVRRGRTRIPPETVPDPDDIGRVAVPDDEGPAEESAVGAEGGSRPTGPVPARHARRAGPTPDPAPVPAPAEGAAPLDADGVVQDVRPVVALDDAPEEAELSAVPVTAVAPGATLAAVGAGRTTVTASVPAATTTALRAEPAAVPASPPDPPAAPEGRAPVSATPESPAPESPAPQTPAPGGPASGGAGDGDATSDRAGSIVGSSAVMAAGTLLSRVLGMLRVVVLAWAVGAAFSADAYNIANTLPNSLFLLIGGGVLNAVLVPQIVRAMEQPDGGQAYVDRLITLSLAVLAGATVVVTAAAPLLLRLYVPATWSGTRTDVGVAFAFWFLPQVFFYGLYTVLGQVLNARGSFGPYMWAPVVNNVVAIAGTIVFVLLYGSGARPAGWWTGASIAVLAGTTTLGVVAQALVLVPVLRRAGFRWRPRWGVRGVGLRSAGQAAGWTFGALAVGQLGLVLLSRIVSDAGQQAGDTVGRGRFVYDTAFLLFMLPHSLVAVSVVTAVFTRMSASIVDGRLGEVRTDLSVALRTTGVATVLATVAFAVLGSDLTALLLHSDPRAARALAWTTTAMVVGLVPFSAQYLFQRVFYAFSDARTPFWVQVMVVTVWSVGNVLAGRLLEGVQVVVGIAAASSVANLLGAAVTLVLVRRRLGGVDGRRVASMYARCVLAVAPAGVLAWSTSAAAHLFAGEGTRGALLALLAGSAVLLLVYLAGLKLLRVRELDDLAAPVRRLVGL
jgi:putative peptidoglycan lipid II flippase